MTQAKCRKLRDNQQQQARSSRLCDLPDAVLFYILSFLPMKDVVRTSVLSKKWQYLWASTPRLEFCESDFATTSLFMDFVNRAFIFRDRLSIKAFKLSCEVPHDRINAWITAAMAANLVELSITNLKDPERPYTFPCSTFGCRSLEKLELDSSGILRSPSSVWLSSLKIICLTRVKFVDFSTVEKLFSSPLLVELSLVCCKWVNLKTVTISAPKLLWLWIDDISENFCEEIASYDRQVQIYGASLKSFFYQGDLIHRYCIRGSMLKLVDVDINVCHSYQVQSDPVADHSHKLLSSLTSVKSLTLSDEFLKDLASKMELVDALPLFNKMTKLAIDWQNVTLECPALLTLLERSPFLTTLEFIEGFNLPMSCEGLSSAVPLCFCSQLKEIDIGLFRATAIEYEVVKALLRAATVLEEMVIHVKDEVNKESISEELMNFRRGLNCRIQIVPLKESLKERYNW